LKKKVLFVCLGNICRSPAAEGIFTSMVEKRNLENKIEIDSAGTIAYHAGEKADQRMSKHAKQRGYNLTSLARKFDQKNDFDNFDYIITMDDENYRNVKALDYDNKYGDKIFKMVSFSKNKKYPEVPDPYFGGTQGFELVLDILEDACSNLLDKIEKDLEQENREQN
jgi:protein-tyrosine phosphatase